MDIKNIYDAVIFASAAVTLKDALVEAVSKKANLHGADLHGADLSGAYLHGADLSGANLHEANLHGANLHGANLHGADLREANLHGAYLRGADLREANLHGAYLHGADLREANLHEANLREAKNAELVIARLQFIPVEGAFIAWKKCRANVIVKLSIPDDAKRSHGGERKCRASHVDCLEVIGADKGISLNNPEVIYRKGERVIADSFDEVRWNVCSHGIHFFLTKEEAQAYEG